ncbi:hypothetical protein ACFFLS_24045 [Flavobacterium procerum]|uniref:Uncharacterized protein n=1 Tax=Flavobacterium procerum TaxID=1455569 RepID=A0ABV6BXI0_9FLAO
MKNHFITCIILIVLFSSCKDNSEKKTDSENSVKEEQKIDSLKSEEVDSIQADPEISIIKPKTIPLTDELKKHIGEEIDSVKTIDFTGDKVLDFICIAKPDTTGIANEYWVSSEYKTIKKVKNNLNTIHHRWFINLDDDPEPEIYEAIGEEDGVNYTIQDQNLQTGKDKILLYINPVIIEKNKIYWGYAWDTKNIIARKNGKVTEVFCSLNHTIERDGNEETNPKAQKQMPVLFFSGHHTQEGFQLIIKDEQWLSLKEIIKKTKR